MTMRYDFDFSGPVPELRANPGLPQGRIDGPRTGPLSHVPSAQQLAAEEQREHEADPETIAQEPDGPAALPEEPRASGMTVAQAHALMLRHFPGETFFIHASLNHYVYTDSDRDAAEYMVTRFPGNGDKCVQKSGVSLADVIGRYIADATNVEAAPAVVAELSRAVSPENVPELPRHPDATHARTLAAIAMEDVPAAYENDPEPFEME
jgi:hypothetical protein